MQYMCTEYMYVRRIYRKLMVCSVARVTSVGEREVTVTDKKSGATRSIPYGICVWSTGVAPQPITKTIMSKAGQGRGWVASTLHIVSPTCTCVHVVVYLPVHICACTFYTYMYMYVSCTRY